MAISILLATPSTGFGELIRQTLVDEGGYQVFMVESGQEALQQAQEHPFSLAILDADIRDLPIAEVARALLEIRPELRTILVPPKNDPNHPTVAELSPDGYLSKPFYLPDLTGIVRAVLRGEKQPPSSAIETGQELPPGDTEGEAPEFPTTPAEPATSAQQHETPLSAPVVTEESERVPVEPPPWLADVNKAAQLLTRLSLESAAHAALITRQDKLWAYAGGYPQPAVEELAEAVSRYWGRQEGRDLARFIKLESTGEEYMLYATRLAGDMVLSLVFDTRTPFTKIRSQVNNLAQALASRPGENPLAAREQAPPTSTEDPAPTTKPDVSAPEFPQDWIPDSLEDDLQDDQEKSGLLDIPSDWRPDKGPSGERRTFLEDLLPDAIPAAPLPYEEDLPGLDERLDIPETLSPREETPAPDTAEDQTTRTPPATEVPFHEAETKPSEVQRPSRMPPPATIQYESRVEPVLPTEPTPALYNLTYACVLIPRFPHHYLTSDLAARLSEWIPHICIAFGWRVEHLSIRPEYAQWMVNVPPATSPGYLMRIIRKVTSQRIFSSFPHLQEENPSGEFWAPGYLIISSTQLPPQQMVTDFIKRTRKRQGLG